MNVSRIRGESAQEEITVLPLEIKILSVTLESSSGTSFFDMVVPRPHCRIAFECIERDSTRRRTFYFQRLMKDVPRDRRDVAKFVRDCVLEVMTHELDEMLYLGQERLNDPHPESYDRGPSPILEHVQNAPNWAKSIDVVAHSEPFLDYMQTGRTPSAAAEPTQRLELAESVYVQVETDTPIDVVEKPHTNAAVLIVDDQIDALAIAGDVLKNKPHGARERVLHKTTLTLRTVAPIDLSNVVINGVVKV